MVDVSKARDGSTSNSMLDEMTWPEVKAALDGGRRTVIAAAGSIEQHGPHLPLQTDTLLGTFLVERSSSGCPGVVQGPTIPFGVSEHHMPFCGNDHARQGGLQGGRSPVRASLASHGFETIVIVPSHGGNFGPLGELEEETAAASATRVSSPTTT